MKFKDNFENPEREKQKKNSNDRQENLLIARQSDNPESDIGEKVYIQQEMILFSSEINQLRDSQQMCIFSKKCSNLAENCLATPNLSWN